MPMIEYVPKRFGAGSCDMIDQANEVINDYLDQDLTLSLRQLYYRFVAGDVFPDDRKWRWTGSRWVRDPNGTKNATPNYKWLGSIINDARLAGLVDWEAIEDRGRNLIDRSHWESPNSIISAAAESYAIDLWEGQEYRCECWVEKEALVAIIDQASGSLDVACFACRGYNSQSEMWRASLRFRQYADAGQTPVVIYLGDHDPSGIDMTRDIRDRLYTFCVPTEVNRIALNMDQIDEYNPPPNPAKLSDSRAHGYIVEFGDDSWELDALEPSTMRTLIQDTIRSYLDEDLYQKRVDQQREEREELDRIATDLRGEME